MSVANRHSDTAPAARALPRSWRLRPAVPADFAAIAELRNACRLAEGEPGTDDAESVAAAWTEPGCDLASDCVVAELPDGTIAGCDEVYDRGAHRVYDCYGGDVRPEARESGIRSALLAWVERRVRELIPRAPDGAEVRIQSAKPDSAPPEVTRVIERAGFRPLRTFVRMRAPLTERSAAIQWPHGVRLEAVRPADGDQTRELWQARVDTFADHWGAVPPDPALGVARFRHEVGGASFDPSLYWAARAGNAVVGICFCRGSFRGDDRLGFVGHLGVVPGWRRRGLARALLRHAMAELKAGDRTHVELGVDAEHPTGARDLYEDEGFREIGRIVLRSKTVRAGEPGDGAES